VPRDDPQSILDLLTLPVSDFVDASYRLLLRRRPGPAEVAEQSGVLHAGLGRIRFLSDLSVSVEYRAGAASKEQGDAAFLEELYMRYLGRPVDPQGMDRYLGLLARGRSRERIRRTVAGSREARSKRTLWFELDRLLEDERTERYWLRRWFGRSRRRERRKNLMHEMLLNHIPERAARAPTSAGEAIARMPDGRADAVTGLSREAQRVLARARHAARR